MGRYGRVWYAIKSVSMVISDMHAEDYSDRMPQPKPLLHSIDALTHTCTCIVHVCCMHTSICVLALRSSIALSHWDISAIRSYFSIYKLQQTTAAVASQMERDWSMVRSHSNPTRCVAVCSSPQLPSVRAGSGIRQRLRPGRGCSGQDQGFRRCLGS